MYLVLTRMQGGVIISYQVSVAVSLVFWTLLFSCVCWFILPETECSNFILPKTDHYNAILFPNDYCNHRNVIRVKSSCSDAHGCQSPVTDLLKSQKTDCSNPHQDLGPIKMQFWSPRVPFFLWCCGQACHCFPTTFQASGQLKTQTRWQNPDHRGTMFWLM